MDHEKKKLVSALQQTSKLILVISFSLWLRSMIDYISFSRRRVKKATEMHHTLFSYLQGLLLPAAKLPLMSDIHQSESFFI